MKTSISNCEIKEVQVGRLKVGDCFCVEGNEAIYVKTRHLYMELGTCREIDFEGIYMVYPVSKLVATLTGVSDE